MRHLYLLPIAILIATACETAATTEALESVVGYGDLYFGDTAAQVSTRLGPPSTSKKDSDGNALVYWRPASDPLCSELSARIGTDEVGTMDIECRVKDGFSINDIRGSLTAKYGTELNVGGNWSWKSARREVSLGTTDRSALVIRYRDIVRTERAASIRTSQIKARL
jgi:hypothetical protein